MAILNFMSNSPDLTVVLAIIICITIWAIVAEICNRKN